MVIRTAILTVCFLATAGYANYAIEAEAVPLIEPLGKLPTAVARWQGRDEPAFTPNILSALGVDQYINRIYSAPGEPFVSLYVGYYQSQREGDTMHSPLNCLPGAGWQPLVTERVALPVPGRAEPIAVKRFIVQKGLDRAVVLYWYQSHGRVVASEYTSKLYLVYDALRLNRSDGALVRVVSPVAPAEPSAAPAGQRAAEFVQAVFPLLEKQLP